MNRRTSELGLTLIEMMIALAVLALMSVSVWTSFRGTIRGIETGTAIQNRYAMLRNTISRMDSEISMAYLSFNRPVQDDKYFTLFEGRDSSEKDNLTFSAFAHVRMRKDANESDQSVIQYFLAPDPENEDRTHLYRRESNRLTGDLPEILEKRAPAYIFCEDVESLDFQYWDPKNEEWINEWRTTKLDQQPDRLPPRVRFTLGIRDQTGEKVQFISQTVLFMQEKIDLSK